MTTVTNAPPHQLCHPKSAAGIFTSVESSDLLGPSCVPQKFEVFAPTALASFRAVTVEDIYSSCFLDETKAHH
jgi:hypothetical protein